MESIRSMTYNLDPMTAHNGFHRYKRERKYVFPISEELYERDPLESEVGELILAESIQLLQNVGVSGMNLHMLSERIGLSYETILRYFVDKYQLLAYLNEFYWHWMAHWISVYQMASSSSQHQLIISLQCLCHEYPPLQKSQEPYIYPLFNVLVTEPLKQEVFFSPDYTYSGMNWGYKKLVMVLTDILKEISPEYPFSKNLAISLVESVNQHQFIGQVMPEWNKDDGLLRPRLSTFLIDLSMNVLLEYKD